MITLLTGNSRILLTLNQSGNWTNLYYPYAGQYEHIRQFKLGLFTENPDGRSGSFEWLGEPALAEEGGRKRRHWKREQGYVTGSDAQLEEARAAGLGSMSLSDAPRTLHKADDVEVEVVDAVHPNHDLILRRIRVKNLTDDARRYRLFTYQGLNIQESMYRDTAYWDESRASLVHYKRNHYFKFWGSPAFDGFTCGEHTLKGLEGSYRDAEDGKLEGGRISHGAADSVAQWNVDVAPGEEGTVYLYLAIGHGRKMVNASYRQFAERHPESLLQEAISFSFHWLQNKNVQVPSDLSEKVRNVYQRSIFVLKDNASHSGSIIASPDPRTLTSGGDTYLYNWWRDGGYISKAMDEVGLYEYARRFLQFAQACQEDEGYFIHRHFPDGTPGSSWHPPPFLQIDQTATVVSAVWHHFKRQGDVDELLAFWPLVKHGANFLESFRDDRGLPLPSYDLWEERKGVMTYSAATVVHALERAARIGEQLGKDARNWRAASQKMRDAMLEHMWNEKRGAWFKSIDPQDETLDASTLFTVKLGILDAKDERAHQLVEAVEGRLWQEKTGGIARYEGDIYYGPETPWIICTLWLGEAHLILGNAERCRELIEWSAHTASPTHMMPEQLNPETGAHTSVTPLVWSHSTLVDVVNKYGRRDEPT